MYSGIFTLCSGIYEPLEIVFSNFMASNHFSYFLKDFQRKSTPYSLSMHLPKQCFKRRIETICLFYSQDMHQIYAGFF